MDEATSLNLKMIIEAMLFASGEAVSLWDISNSLHVPSGEVRAAAEELMSEYDEQMRGLRIIFTKDSYQMTTRNEYYPYIKALLGKDGYVTLSTAALETLAIVAYRQPVTRADIEQIRGVTTTSALDTLLARGLVEECGKLDLPGKPRGFVTTNEFLKFMNAENIEELPSFESFRTVDMGEAEGGEPKDDSGGEE